MRTVICGGSARARMRNVTQLSVQTPRTRGTQSGVLGLLPHTQLLQQLCPCLPGMFVLLAIFIIAGK